MTVAVQGSPQSFLHIAIIYGVVAWRVFWVELRNTSKLCSTHWKIKGNVNTEATSTIVLEYDHTLGGDFILTNQATCI